MERGGKLPTLRPGQAVDGRTLPRRQRLLPAGSASVGELLGLDFGVGQICRVGRAGPPCHRASSPRTRRPANGTALSASEPQRGPAGSAADRTFRSEEPRHQPTSGGQCHQLGWPLRRCETRRLRRCEKTRLLIHRQGLYLRRMTEQQGDMPELWMLSATELVRQIRTGQVSSREVVQAHLHRIDEINPVVNALTAVLDEQALAAADAVDQALRCGEEPGPLCGIPVTVKENVDVAGSATTQGIAALRDATATQDAPHIAELRAAGAIPIARTNMPEFGIRWHTTNGLHGATRNPGPPSTPRAAPAGATPSRSPRAWPRSGWALTARARCAGQRSAAAWRP